MLKRVQAFVVVLSMVLTYSFVGVASAQETEEILAFAKTEFLVGEPIEFEVNAVSEEWVENGAFVGCYMIDGDVDEYDMYEYLDEGFNVLAFDGLFEEGTYEIRVYSCDEPIHDEDLITKVAITVGGSAWGAFEVAADADEYAYDTDPLIIVSGVPQFMIDNYAFIGIYEKDAAFDEPYDYDFIADADVENSIELIAPEPGVYEVRAYSAEFVTSDNQLVAKFEIRFMPPIDAETDEEDDGEALTELPDSVRIIFMIIGSDVMTVNGEDIEIDPGFGTTPVLTSEGRVIVPIRAVITALGGLISWDSENQTLTMEANGNTVVMTIGQTSFLVNGEEQTMDVAPEIMNGRTMIPLRAAGEALNCSVNWIGEEQEIQIILSGE